MADPDDARDRDQDAQNVEGDMYQRDSGTTKDSDDEMSRDKQE